jgi:hypothetical protein
VIDVAARNRGGAQRDAVAAAEQRHGGACGERKGTQAAGRGELQRWVIYLAVEHELQRKIGGSLRVPEAYRGRAA